MKKIKTCLFNRDCVEDGTAMLPLDGTGLVMAFTLPGRDFPELASREDMEKVLGGPLDDPAVRQQLKQMALEKMPYSIKRYGPDSLSQYYYAVKAMYDEGYGSAAILNEEVRDCLGRMFPGGYYVLPRSVNMLLVYPKWSRRADMQLTLLKAIIKGMNRAAADQEKVLSDDIFVVEGGRLMTAA